MSWITVCGGGNGAHALIGTLLLRDNTIQIRLYLPIEEERSRFAEAISCQPSFELRVAGKVYSVASKRIHVTADPKEAARSSVIIMVVPAFAHEPILLQLAPYLTKENTIAALPARSGLEYQAWDILGRADREECTVVGFQTLPWACRVEQFGHSAAIFGIKKRVGAACLPSKETAEIAKMFFTLLGIDIILYQSMLELSLANAGQLIHPGIMYGAFGDRHAEVFPSEDEVPLFYASVDNEAAEFLSRMSDEVLTIRDMVEQERPGFKMPSVVHVCQWLNEAYGEQIGDSSSLARKLQTNPGYQTLKLPVRKAGSGYQVDVEDRYLTEDVPFGLLVTKGVALILNVDTPTIDKVISEISGWIGKEYLVGGRMIGCDVTATRVPQKYGINSLKGLLQQEI